MAGLLSLHQDGDVSHLLHLAPPLPGWRGGSACNEESHHSIDSSDCSHLPPPLTFTRTEGVAGWWLDKIVEFFIF